MLKFAGLIYNTMKVLLLLAWLAFIGVTLDKAPWPLTALAVIGTPLAVWLHWAWWLPKVRAGQAALQRLRQP